MSILLGIDQSLHGGPARRRSASQHGRRRTARPGTGLTVVERKGLQRVSGHRVVARRDSAVAAEGMVLDAWSQHDLVARDGCGSARRARPRVLLADDPRLG